MTEFNKPTQEKDWDALAEKQLASIKSDMKISFEDATVRAAHKMMATELQLEPAWPPATPPAHGRGWPLAEPPLASARAEFQTRNNIIEEVAQHIEKLTGFGQDTISSFAIYIREMKK